jgi:hypothetical protein
VCLETGQRARLEVALAEGGLLWVNQRSRVALRVLAMTDGFSDRRS